MLVTMIERPLLKLRTSIRKVIFPVKPPDNWDEQAYLVENPDVKVAIESGIVGSGFEHWLRRGVFEGRRMSSSDLGMAFQWNEEDYLSKHPEVKEAVQRGDFSSGLEHWQLYGRHDNNKKPPQLPDWLKNEMRALSEIEPKLFPSQTFCNRLTAYYPGKHVQSGTARLYVKLVSSIGQQSFTHVFLLPWLKTGGADLEAIHHITTLSSQFGARILVILTENSKSPWLSRLPQSVTTLRFGRVAAGVDHLTAEIALVRLLLKLKPAVIHNVHCAIGWRVFSQYGAALHSISKLYVSLLLFDYTLEGEPVGYARDIEKVYPYLDGVFCDSEAFAAKLSELYGVRRDFFSVMRYPVRIGPRFSYVADDRPKILWAGRLDRQKRPDILCKIAKSLPHCMFHVYGDSVLESVEFSRRVHGELKQLRNVILFGRYDGFETIPTNNYAVFLYTTQWDGMPNVILEALASGLVVLAPNVGGISEVIPPDSGFLIPRFDDVDAYVSAIRQLLSNPQRILQEREKRFRLLSERYSLEQFSAALARLPSYSMTSPKVERSTVATAVAH